MDTANLFYIHLTKHQPLADREFKDPDQRTYHELLEDLTIVDTLCGEQEMVVLCLGLDQYVFFLQMDLNFQVCPDCLDHPDVGLAILKYAP